MSILAAHTHTEPNNRASHTARELTRRLPVFRFLLLAPCRRLLARRTAYLEISTMLTTPNEGRIETRRIGDARRSLWDCNSGRILPVRGLPDLKCAVACGRHFTISPGRQNRRIYQRRACYHGDLVTWLSWVERHGFPMR